jgi:hypothetical protein
VKGALGGLNGELEPKKFNALSAPAQRFVLLLNSMRGSARALQRSVQEGLFPGLSKGLEAARPALAALSGPLHMTAVDLGRIGEEGGHLVGSKGFLADLRSQAQFNNVQLLRLGGAALFVLDGLRQLSVASRPLVSWLVLLASGWAMSADKTLIADRANGKLAAGFAFVKRVGTDVLKIGGNLGKTLFNIGNIARKSLGEGLLESLGKGSESLKHWTESGPGIAKLTTFFERAKPVVYAFANLIGAAVKDFLKFGSSPGSNRTLVQFLNQLRTEVLPQLLKVTEGVTKLFELITSKVPGGGWLITFAYALHTLGGGGLIGGIANGLGRQFGIKMASGLAGETAVFDAAGGSLGLVFAGGLAAAVLGYGLGKIISNALPNGILGKPEAKPQQTNNAIQGLGKGTYVEKGVIRPNRGFGHTSLGGKPAVHGSTVHVYDRLLHRYVDVHPGEALPGPTPVHKGAALRGPTVKAPATVKVARSGGAGRGSAGTHVQTHITLELKDKPLAEATHDFVARDEALD